MIKIFLKDSFWYFGTNALHALSFIVAIPIITRHLGAEQYGLYQIMVTAIGLAYTLSVGWVIPGIVRFSPAQKSKEESRRFLGAILLLGMGGTFILLTVTWMVGHFVDTELTSIAAFTGLLVLIVMLESILQIPLNVFRSKRELHYYSFFFSIYGIGRLSVGIYLLLKGGGIHGLLAGWAISLGCCGLMAFSIAVRQKWFALPSRKEFRQIAKGIARYGFPVMMMTFAVWMLSVSDRYLLGLLMDMKHVGVYSASREISEKSLVQIVSVSKLALGPIIFNTWEKEGMNACRDLMPKLATIYMLVMLPASVGLGALSKTIVAVLLPNEYWAGHIVIPLIACGVFFWGLNQYYTTVFALYKKPEIQLAGLLVVGLLSVGLNLIFIPHYGFMAAAWITLISYAASFVIAVILSKRFFSWPFPFRMLAKLLVASTVMAGSVFSITKISPFGNVTTLAIAIGVGMITYSLVVIAVWGNKDPFMPYLSRLKRKYLRTEDMPGLY